MSQAGEHEGEYQTENALCEAFAADARSHGWVVYPEQGGWDILLVRRGVQVGVQAKLVANTKVLVQALPDNRITASNYRERVQRALHAKGPHYRAVLLGSYPGRTPHSKKVAATEFNVLARHLRIVVLTPPHGLHGWRGWVRCGWEYNQCVGWRLDRFDALFYRWFPRNLEYVPPFVPDHAAGIPCPRVVGPWQIAAVKMELRYEKKGYVTLLDAREVAETEGGSWNPSTMLHRFFDCSGEDAPEGGRLQKWVMKPWEHYGTDSDGPASKRWPSVLKALNKGE